MDDALLSLETQYLFLTSHLNEYENACQTDSQKNSFVNSYVESRRNYWGCINKTFNDEDPKVAAVIAQMGTAQKSLEDSLNKLKEIATVLDTIASAVKIGGKLATLAGK